MTDIDIDFADRSTALNIFKHITASINDDKKHNTGVYFHSIPYNPVTNLSTINYKEAEQNGFFKIDFLNVNMYNGIRDRTHLLDLMHKEPLWNLLEQDDFTDLLFHVNGYGSILRELKPDSIEKLAAVIAIIRPAKRYLIGEDWQTIFNEVWVKPTTAEFYFRKSHSIAYAHAIVVQMNLICESVVN